LPSMPQDFAHLAGLLSGELLAGGILGWLARTVALALPAAGQIVSLSTGLSSVLQPDQNFGAQSASLGRLFGIGVPVLIFGTGLYALRRRDRRRPLGSRPCCAQATWIPVLPCGTRRRQSCARRCLLPRVPR